MIVYHGTTGRRARRIATEGFLPKKPSRRVWFAESRGYAVGRAKTQARRAHDRPVVLTCQIDLTPFRARLGGKRVFQKAGIIAITGVVPVSVLRSVPLAAGQPTSPQELADWVNDLLRLKRYKGVSPKHAGIDRLSQWVVNRLTTTPNKGIRPAEMVDKARRWLPESFENVRIDPEDLHVYRLPATAFELKAEPAKLGHHPREDEAVDCLASPRPRRRVKGLEMLAQLGDPELFEWCSMFLDDESVDVRMAALRTMLSCEEADTDLIEPLAKSRSKRIRAAATAALVKHSEPEDAVHWLELGLKDPQPCVRVETAGLLAEIDPDQYRSPFKLALYDNNPVVANTAERLIRGHGYSMESW